ncbi:hypothetical protein N0V86_002223 [Didymella sp. IMI 355093]|nr:hypothetical protein N0V86_002223 [Didymella sp. IMI 355093]
MATMDLQVPTVTVEDLRDFHAKHFSHAPAPEHILHGVENEPAEEYYEEEENVLGYYEDGTPRTLTDEQIAMFRHSEIQAIIRKRRLKRENGNTSEQGETEDGEVEESAAEASSKVTSPASQATPATAPTADKVASGRVEKLKSQSQQWTTSSPRTKARNKRNRDKYKAKKRDERFKREQNRKHNREEDDESDEWDPWHQAKGPDVQKDDTVDLDY